MLNELSLHILDVANNSVRANAKLIKINIEEDTKKNLLTIQIIDDGCGMTKEQVQAVEDPFYTTRTTRKVGFGVSFFKMAALLCDGEFKIDSVVNEGTEVCATFKLNHINRMPIGDMASTFCVLAGNESLIDICYTHKVDDNYFVADTREFKEILGDIPLSVPDVSVFINNYCNENLAEIHNK